VFKFCNYVFVLAKVNHVLFGIVWDYFITYEVYFVVGEFLLNY
jgi:hypothetical protein